MSLPEQGPRPISDDLLSWARAMLALPDDAHSDLQAVAGDASNRRYFRLSLPSGSAVLMEAPPATEKNAEFLAVQQVLKSAGVRVPGVIAADLERGYLLLEDLGDRLLLPELTPATVDGWYHSAFGILERLASVTPGRGAAIPGEYDAPLLREELSRLSEWFLQRLLGLQLTDGERGLLAAAEELLVGRALAQPRVLVHRDFHSRNLMPQEDGQLAVIDFQDAVFGPVTYDLVSLLRDCYIRWPPGRVEGWAREYHRRLCSAGILAEVPVEDFLCDFDLMGLQRHLKVLGTFARLFLRDGKPAYLRDLPLVLGYVDEVLERRAGESPPLSALRDWWGQRVSPAVAAQTWSASA